MVLCPICEKAIRDGEDVVYFTDKNTKEYDDPVSLEEMHEMEEDVYHIDCTAFTAEEIRNEDFF